MSSMHSPIGALVGARGRQNKAGRGHAVCERGLIYQYINDNIPGLLILYSLSYLSLSLLGRFHVSVVAGVADHAVHVIVMSEI